MEFGPLVDAAWIRDHIGDRNLRVIDFRWYLRGRSGRDEYVSGHIPGAVFVDLETVTGNHGGGRHPLPAPEQFEREMRKAGISSETRVVVYDDATAAPTATRLWFLLALFGHHAQAVLDGGLQAWGQALETAVPDVAAGDFHSAPPDMARILDCAAVAQVGDVPVIDARAPERYRGETEPIDPKAGHIPGAVNRPYSENVTADGKFKSREVLRREFERIGAQNGAVFYCGSGVNATQQLLAMEVAGIPNARLYAGSWSDWSNRDLPVATGSEP